MLTGNAIQDRLKRRLVWLLGVLNHWALFKFIREAQAEYKWQGFKAGLASCGAHVSIQWPITIAGASQVRLGENVSLAAYVHIWGWGGVCIGDRVMIGTHTSITSQTHDYAQESMYQTMVMKPVIIEDDVWIGSNCVIMPGVRVGHGAVIGAGSVVTQDVEPDMIVVGVPARPFKRRR